MLDVVKGDMVLPKEKYMGLLQKLVGELKEGAASRTGLPRVMITGSLSEAGRESKRWSVMTFWVTPSFLHFHAS